MDRTFTASMMLCLLGVALFVSATTHASLESRPAPVSLAGPEGALEERAFADSVTSTFDDELTAWRATAGGIAENAGNDKVFWLGSPSQPKRARGVMIQFFGVGADNATGTCRVWLISQGGAGSTPDSNSLRRAYFGEAAFTLSTLTGVSGSVVAGTDVKFADTIVWTLSSDATSIKGPGSAIEAAFGSPGSRAYSPGSNADYAVLFLPDLGNAEGIVLEMDKGTATSVNATITRVFN